MDENKTESFSRASAEFKAAADLWRRAGDAREQAHAELRCGQVFHKTGEWEKASDAYMRALKLLDTARDEVLRLDVIIGLSQARGHMGQGAPRELPSHEAVLAFWERIGDRRGEAMALARIGMAYGRAGDIFRHRDYCVRALQLYEAIGDYRGQANALEDIGTAYGALKDFDLALEYHARKLFLTREIRDRRGEAAALSHIGDSLTKGGRADDGIYYLERSAGLRREMGDRNAEKDMCALLAQAYQQKGDYPRALAASKRVVELDESIRSSIEWPTRRAGTSSHSMAHGVVEDLVRAYEQSRDDNDLAKSFETADQYRARFFQEARRATDSVSLAAIQKELLDEDTVLLEYWLTGDQGFLWVATTSSLQFFRVPDRNVVDRLAQKAYEALTSRNVRISGETPSQRRLRVEKADDDYRGVAARLGDAVLQPAAAHLSKKRVLIVSDGRLLQIPFAALADHKGDPLILNHEIVSIPSAAAVVTMQRERAARKAPSHFLALLADPVFESQDSRLGRSRHRPRPLDPNLADATRAFIPDSPGQGIPRLAFAAREARGILALAPPQETLSLLDFDATRDAFLDGRLNDYRVVHVGSHGFVNHDDPDISGLVLSLVDRQGRPREGFLRLHDVYQIKLQADLVVLSACQTALGKVFSGEPLIGLTSGFLRSGAAGVVSTTWKVDDEATSELMQEFYRGMWGPERLSPSAALRAAQLAISRKDQWRAPYFWAGVVLHGQWK